VSVVSVAVLQSGFLSTYTATRTPYKNNKKVRDFKVMSSPVLINLQLKQHDVSGSFYFTLSYVPIKGEFTIKYAVLIFTLAI
jgi:hypothetical protein